MECETAAELTALENLYVLSEREQEMVFERKLEFLCRVADWRIENGRLGLAADLTGTWTPEQRERFLLDWNNDEPLLQTGRGEKRSIGEVDDGAGTSDEVSNNNFFIYLFTKFAMNRIRTIKGPPQLQITKRHTLQQYNTHINRNQVQHEQVDKLNRELNRKRVEWHLIHMD